MNLKKDPKTMTRVSSGQPSKLSTRVMILELLYRKKIKKNKKPDPELTQWWNMKLKKK